jgi:hypothetical protein
VCSPHQNHKSIATMDTKSEHSIDFKPQESQLEHQLPDELVSPIIPNANHFGSKKRIAALAKESAEMYAESLEKYGVDSVIDPKIEKKLVRFVLDDFVWYDRY